MSSLSKRLFLLFAILILAGCAPVISDKTMKEVTPGVEFSDVVKDPDGFRGRTILLGGSIIKTENLEGKSVIEVLQHPLSRGLKPVEPDESKGRFLIEVEGFRDPVIYHPGKLITVAGVVAGSRTKPLGGVPYVYPVIEDREHYLWRAPGYEPSIGIGFGVIFSN